MARLSGFHLEGGIGKTMLDIVHPVNSLYLTVGSENPATVLGGSWAKLTGGVLACAGTSGYASAGATGGSKKISVGQMPSHIHSGTRSITNTLKENTQGNANFAMSGVVEDALFTFDAWTNATGGGRTTTRSTSPSTSGRGRRSAGGFPWLRSSFAKARRSRSTARSLSARAYSARTTRTPSGRARRGIGMERAITSSRRATPTRSTIRTAPTRTCSQSTRCRAIIISFLRSRTAATSPHGAGSGILRRRPAAGGRTAESQIPAAARRTTTCRLGSPCTCGSEPGEGNRNVAPCGEAVPYAA